MRDDQDDRRAERGIEIIEKMKAKVGNAEEEIDREIEGVKAG